MNHISERRKKKKEKKKEQAFWVFHLKDLFFFNHSTRMGFKSCWTV